MTKSACCSAAIRDAWSACKARRSESSAASPARLAVYDAPLDPESITAQMRENLDDEITEVKSENAIDRITSQANPRTLERVPAGARFQVRMVLDVLCEEDKALAARLFEGLRLLEDDALGGGGSARQRPCPLRQSEADVARARILLLGRRGSRDWLRAIWGNCNPPSTILLSPKSSQSKDYAKRLAHPPAARRPVAHRSRFRRSRSRRSHLSQRLAVLGGHVGHGPPGDVGRMAGSHRARIGARRAIQLVLPLSRAIRCWWCRREICGRRRRLPRFAGKARDSCP